MDEYIMRHDMTLSEEEVQQLYEIALQIVCTHELGHLFWLSHSVVNTDYGAIHMESGNTIMAYSLWDVLPHTDLLNCR